VLFWASRLYLDAGLQLGYIGLSVAGWYWWLRGGARPGGPDRAAGGARLAVRSEPWIEVRGTRDERLATACARIDRLLVQAIGAQ
jgi:hypothetical protein